MHKNTSESDFIDLLEKSILNPLDRIEFRERWMKLVPSQKIQMDMNKNESKSRVISGITEYRRTRVGPSFQVGSLPDPNEFKKDQNGTGSEIIWDGTKINDNGIEFKENANATVFDFLKIGKELFENPRCGGGQTGCSFDSLKALPALASLCDYRVDMAIRVMQFDGPTVAKMAQTKLALILSNRVKSHF